MAPFPWKHFHAPFVQGFLALPDFVVDKMGGKGERKGSRCHSTASAEPARVGSKPGGRGHGHPLRYSYKSGNVVSFIALVVQTSPPRITLPDPLDLPCAIPFPDRLFSLDSAFYGFKNLISNHPVHSDAGPRRVRSEGWKHRSFHKNGWIPAFAGMTERNVRYAKPRTS